MFRFTGRLIRLSMLALLLGGAVVAVVGVRRVESAYLSVRDHLRANVDGMVDARVALRHEVENLSREYPRRIADLRGQLSDIDRDVAECEAQRRVSDEVVALCRGDLEVIGGAVAALPAEGGAIAFRGERLTRADAERRAARIGETTRAHAVRGEDLARELTLLEAERERIRSELATTEEEFRSFTAEAASMLREIDALGRQEKLVDLAERRAKTAADPLAERSASLAELKGRIERRRTELSERLNALGVIENGGEYEARARLQLAGR
jgi:chromosome segregation ATPase